MNRTKRAFLLFLSMIVVILLLNFTFQRKNIQEHSLIKEPSTAIKIPNLPQTLKKRLLASSSPTNDLTIAQNLVDQGHWVEAEPILRSIIARDPHNTRALNELMILLESDQKDFKEALAVCRMLVATDINYPHILNKLYELSEESHEIPETIDFLLDHWQAGSPGSDVVAMTIGRLFQTLEDYDSSLFYLSSAIGTQPGFNSQNWELMAGSYRALEEYQRELKALEIAIIERAEHNRGIEVNEPKRWMSMVQLKHKLLQSLIENEKFDKARQVLKDLLIKDPLNVELSIIRENITCDYC